MHKIEDYIAFVKEQANTQDKLANKYAHEAYRSNLHVKAKQNFNELAQYLEEFKRHGLQFDDNSLNRSLTAQKRINLTFEDIQGLPDELIKELNVTDTDRQEMVIEHIIAQSGGVLSLGKLMVQLYRRTGEVHKRNTLISRLYRMAQRGMIFNVPGKKGVYSTYELSEQEARKLFGNVVDGESDEVGAAGTSEAAPLPPENIQPAQKSKFLDKLKERNSNSTSPAAITRRI